MRTRYLVTLAALFVGGLLAAIYWPGLHGSFFFDDGPNIVNAEGVRLEDLSLESLRQVWFSGHAGFSGRPIAQLSFALNYYFSGFSPFAFKASNLAIHAACAILIFALARRLLSGARLFATPKAALIVAGLLATVWLLHPIQLTSVLYVVQRMTSLSALFLLAALLLHISGREAAGRAGAVKLIVAWGVLWPLSYLSKETGLLFPLFALAWELIIRRNASAGLDRFARVFAAVIGVALLAALIYGVSPRGQWLWAGYDLRAFSLGERLLTEGRVLCFYLGLMFFPRLQELGLFHDDIALSTGWLNPWTTLPAIAGLCALLWLLWRMRYRAPLVSFGIAWFLIGHAMESTVLPLEIAHEHRNYLPLFGILLALVSGLPRLLQNKGNQQTIVVALASLMFANFIFVTALRAHQFGEEGRRSQIEAQHHRNSASAQHDAGRVLMGQVDAGAPETMAYFLASSHFQAACDLDPHHKMCLIGLVHLSCKIGKSLNPGWISELVRRLQQTPFAPGDRSVLLNIKDGLGEGAPCLNRVQVEGLFAAALANPSVSPSVQAILYSWYADYLWLQERDMVAARIALGQSLRLNPSSPSNRLKWAQLLYISGEHEQARQLLLALRGENLSLGEQNTRDELLAAVKIGKP